MELKYLQTFRAIVEEGSFTRAADKLGYTRSSITFQMDQLEQSLSATLFEKIGRRMVLTKAGEALVPYVDQVLASVDQLHGFQADLSQCRGDLRVGVAETQLCYRLPPVLKAFVHRAPNARLFLRSMNCYAIRDELLAGTLDVGIFYADVGGFGDSLTTYPMGAWPVAMAAAPEIKAAHPDFTTPDRTIPLALIINETNSIFWEQVEAGLRARSIRLERVMEIQSIPTIRALTESGLGVTVLPRFALEDAFARGTLEEIALPMEPPVLHAVCAHHKNKWKSPLVELFVELAAGN